jgi:hypothetical protein
MKSKQLSPNNLKILKHTLNSGGNGGESLKNTGGESLINISVKKKEINVSYFSTTFRLINPGPNLCPHCTLVISATHIT